MQPSSAPRACLVSVGGSTEPVFHTLRTNRPTLVAYFCSAGSRQLAERIQSELDFAPLAEFFEIGAHEELGPCYSALRTWIPTWLQRHTLAPDEVVVDYTGGTKTMSAALVLAATEHFSRFSYVGGTQRDKAGTGIVITGTERIHYQGNPWQELAVREIDRARALWAEQQYVAAGAILRAAKPHVPLQQRPAFDCVIDLATALADRLALQLHAAAQRFEKLANKLQKRPPAQSAPMQVLEAHDRLISFCALAASRLSSSEATTGPAADPHLQLRELLDNAILTARLGRYDDASARLYRALELYGQNELARLTDGVFQLGQLKSGTLPPSVATCSVFSDTTTAVQKAQDGIALEDVYRVLAHLDHHAAAIAKAEFDGPDALKSSWRQATQRRNQSILAHGIQPVSERGFKDLAVLIQEITGEDTSNVLLEAPAFTTA